MRQIKTNNLLIFFSFFKFWTENGSINIWLANPNIYKRMAHHTSPNVYKHMARKGEETAYHTRNRYGFWNKYFAFLSKNNNF